MSELAKLLQSKPAPANPANPIAEIRNISNISRDADAETHFAEAELSGLSLDELRVEACDDWQHLRADRLRLEAFARAVARTRQREAGIVPGHYTGTTECRGCGPVPIWEGAPERVDGCPWCLNRKRGLPIPGASVNVRKEA